MTEFAASSAAVIVPTAILAAVIVFAAIFTPVMVPARMFTAVIAFAWTFALEIEPAAMFASSTARAASWVELADFVPAVLALPAVEQDGREQVVPVRDDVGVDDDGLAGSPLDRKAAAIHFGVDVLDCHAAKQPLVERNPVRLLLFGGRCRRLLP